MLQSIDARSTMGNALYLLSVYRRPPHRLFHQDIASSSISTSDCICCNGCPCADEGIVRSAIGLPFIGTDCFGSDETPLLSPSDGSSGWGSRRPAVSGPPNPFCSVVWPGAAKLVAAAAEASSRAFFSLNCLYVVVFGITSARKSRLSIRATALA